MGDAENARHEIAGHENAAPECKAGKMRDMNFRHQIAEVENARHEFVAPDCRGGKSET